MNIFTKLKASLQLREAVRQADEAHEKTGERYYVMPSFGGDAKLVVMDRYNFRKLKHKGYITHKATVSNVINECFYFTPYRNGDGFLTKKDRKRKTQQFLAWVEAERKARKQRKKHGTI